MPEFTTSFAQLRADYVLEAATNTVTAIQNMREDARRNMRERAVRWRNWIRRKLGLRERSPDTIDLSWNSDYEMIGMYCWDQMGVAKDLALLAAAALHIGGPEATIHVTRDDWFYIHNHAPDARKP